MSNHDEPLGQQANLRLHRLLTRGTDLMQDGQLSKAVRLLERAYEIAPDNMDAALNLSSAYILTKKFKRAVPILESLVADHEQNAMIWINLGAAYLGNPVLARDEEQQQAVAAFEKALDINPEAPSVAYNLGLIYRDRRDFTTAVAWFRRAVDTNPRDRDAHLMLARMQQALTEEE